MIFEIQFKTCLVLEFYLKQAAVKSKKVLSLRTEKIHFNSIVQLHNQVHIVKPQQHHDQLFIIIQHVEHSAILTRGNSLSLVWL